MSSQLFFVNVCCCLAMLARGNILVYRALTNQFLMEFYDIPAQFGAPIPSTGLRVYPITPNDTLGCSALYPPPSGPDADGKKFVVVIQRGGLECSFEKKVRNAQAANYSAAIVYNVENNDDLEPMSAQNGTGIYIPAVFVAYSTGINLLSQFTDGTSILVINDELPFNINTQLILPFSILIGFCFLIMIFYMIYKCVREERLLRQHRLPKNMLKKLKITKFTKGQQYDMCVICLDEFVEGDKLRVLPCTHAYHSNCIDPWLTKNKRICPICKRKVFAKGETRSNRRRQSSLDSMTDTDDDTTPLLRTAESATPNNHGTFSNSQPDESLAAAAGDQTSDEENVLLTNDSPSRSSQRVNPFDRQPNLPPNLASLLDSRRSVWDYPLLRLFRRRSSNSISIAAPPMVTRRGIIPRSRSEPRAPFNVPEPGAAAGLNGNDSQPTSNNILNPNLSGSFKDDDELETHQTIYEPIATETPSVASTSDLLGIIVMGNNQTQQNADNQQDDQNQQQDSVFIQTPAQGGIGVVALPNANLRNPPHHPNSSQLPPNRQYFI